MTHVASTISGAAFVHRNLDEKFDCSPTVSRIDCNIELPEQSRHDEALVDGHSAKVRTLPSHASHGSVQQPRSLRPHRQIRSHADRRRKEASAHPQIQQTENEPAEPPPRAAVLLRSEVEAGRRCYGGLRHWHIASDQEHRAFGRALDAEPERSGDGAREYRPPGSQLYGKRPHLR